MPRMTPAWMRVNASVLFIVSHSISLSLSSPQMQIHFAFDEHNLVSLCYFDIPTTEYRSEILSANGIWRITHDARLFGMKSSSLLLVVCTFCSCVDCNIVSTVHHEHRGLYHNTCCAFCVDVGCKLINCENRTHGLEQLYATHMSLCGLCVF